MKSKHIFLFSFLSLSLLTSCNSIAGDGKQVVTVYNNSDTISYASTVDMVSAVKASVVDVYAYNSSGYSAGSGVIVAKDTDGYYVITNHHVIKDCTTFEVVTYSDDTSKTYEAEFIGGSPSNDIAALFLKTEDELTLATFGDSSTLKVGQDVIAIGNPLGILGGTVTKGIISALERETYLEEIGYMKLLQTDAAINSGNSGGALFDENGRLVGIVNSGYSDYEGLNFAIPSNAAKASFTSLVETKTSDTYGYVKGESNLGISLNEATIYSDSSLSSSTTAVYIESFSSSTCDGYLSGLKDYTNFYYGNNTTFDAIVKIGDTDITSATDALKAFSSYSPGETVSVSYKEINYKRTSGPGGWGGGQVNYYLSDTTETLDITLTQYIYSLPNS